MPEGDAISGIKTILSANWTAGNTDAVTPNFYASTEQPMRLDYSNTPTSILVYLASHTTIPNDLGPSGKEATTDRVSIDIRTRHSRGHLRNCYEECRRIFSTRINSPNSDFQQLIPLGFVDFSTIGFHRYVYDLHLKHWSVTR